MGYAGYIGRVGALAVALGIGVAVAQSPTASADDTAPGSTSSASSSSQAGSAAPDTSPHKRSTKDSRAPSASHDTEDDASDPAEADGADDVADSTDDGEAHEDSGSDDDDVSSDATADDEVPTGEVSGSDGAPVAEESDVADDLSSGPVVAEVASGEETPGASSADDVEVTEAAEPAGDVVSEVSVPVVLATPEVARANPVATLLAAWGFPGSPDSPPLTAELLWAWVRRTVVGAFYNRAPVVHPVQISATEGGQAEGSLQAVDPDGDPMQFSIDAQPEHGVVVLGADGSWTYTPDDPAFTGVDVFTVTVRDIGLRLISRPGVTTATVAVRLGQDLVLTAPQVGAPDVDGKVTGSLGLTDPNAVGSFRYQIVDRPLYGTVEFDAATGGFAYTPTLIGRIKAATIPGLVDSFTVTATNGISPTVAITVNNLVVKPGPVSVTQRSVGTNSMPFGVVLSKDGTRAYVTNVEDGTVSVINLRTGSVSTPITVGANPVALTVSPDGTRLYVVNSYNTVVTVDTTTATVVGTPIRVRADAQAIVVSPKGTRLYISNTGDNSVSVISTITAKVLRTIAVGAAPLGMAISPDGRHLYVANSDSDGISVIDTVRNRLIGSATVGQGPIAITVNADGSRLYVATAGLSTVSADGAVVVLDATTLKPIGAPIPVGDYPAGLSLSADGTQLYVANALSNEISVVDTTTREVAGITIDSTPISALAVSGPNGPLILVSHADPTNDVGLISFISLNGDEPLTLTPPLASAIPDNELVQTPVVLPEPNPPLPGDWTFGFDVTNLTSHEIVLEDQYYQRDNGLPGRGTGPTRYAILEPGETHHFEVSRFIFSSPNMGHLTYQDPKTLVRWYIRLDARGWGSFIRCDDGCTHSGGTAMLYDAPGTTTTIGADQKDEQIKALNALCKTSTANCKFTVTRTEDSKTTEHRVGNAYSNPFKGDMARSQTVTDTVTTTTNLSLSANASFEVLKAVKAELTDKFRFAYREVQTFSKTMDYTIESRYQAWVVAQSPITRYWGDMTIKVGRSTVIVKDIYVDAPRGPQSGPAEFKVVKEKLLTGEIG